MNIKYSDLFNQGDLRPNFDSHKLAVWLIVNRGDIVELPDIFSYRTVYFRTILQHANDHAKKINATIHAWTEKKTINYPNGSICLQFRGPESKRPERAANPEHFNSSNAPKHRGQYYGPESIPQEQKIIYTGWNLVSINFYPQGEPQPSEID